MLSQPATSTTELLTRNTDILLDVHANTNMTKTLLQDQAVFMSSVNRLHEELSQLIVQRERPRYDLQQYQHLIEQVMRTYSSVYTSPVWDFPWSTSPRMFNTDRGCTGLSMVPLQAGDIIIQMNFSPFPSVLRPIPRKRKGMCCSKFIGLVFIAEYLIAPVRGPKGGFNFKRVDAVS